MIEFMFLKVLTLISQVQLKNVLFVIIGIFKIKDLSFNHLSVMGIMVY